MIAWWLQNTDKCALGGGRGLGFYHKMKERIMHVEAKAAALLRSSVIPQADRRVLYELIRALEEARGLLDDWRYDTFISSSLHPRPRSTTPQPRNRMRSGTRRLGVPVSEPVGFKVPEDEGDEPE